jgi:hypothetical protein
MLLLGCPARIAQAATLSDADREKIEAALPAKAIVAARQHRRLLIFDRNVNYGGHASIPVANAAFTRMGEKTGAFETEVSSDPTVFQPESLRRFDAVFFNNNVGNLFEDPALRQSLIDFIYGGGGMMGVHGTTVAFTKWPGAIEDWPEFGLMIGARGANHKASNEQVMIKLDDPMHPLNQPFGGNAFEYRDEFFRVHGPYSRNRVRVLLAIDTERTDMNQTPSYGQLLRADNDYALAWVRQYGRGRSFYCTIAHNPSVFWDTKMLQFYLGAVQFILGDLEAPTTPSAKLTPALRAQERLQWRVGLQAERARPQTLFETIDQASSLGLVAVGAHSSQLLSGAASKQVDEQLSEAELRELRFKLDEAGVRLLTYSVPQWPSEATACRNLFHFARKLGAEAVIVEGIPQDLDLADNLCEECDMKLAVGPPATGDAARLLPRLEQRSPRVGVVFGARQLSETGMDGFRSRLLTIQVEAGTERDCLRELAARKLQPVMIGVDGTQTTLTNTVAVVNKASIEAAIRFHP